MKSNKDAPKRIEWDIKYLEKLDGEPPTFNLTLGEHDYIGIADAPNDEVVMRFILALGIGGNMGPITTKA